MVYQDKLMTTLWKTAIFISPATLDDHCIPWSLSVCSMFKVYCAKSVCLCMYIHRCFVFMDILGKSIFHIFVKNLEKPFVKAGKNFQCPETRSISGDLHSTVLLNLWPSACCWRSAICALVIFITLFLLSQINRWSLRNFFFLVDVQIGDWREEKTEFTLAIKMACGPPTKGAYWGSRRFGCHLFLTFVFHSKNRGACLTLKTSIGKEHCNKLHGVRVFLFLTYWSYW